VVEGPGVVAQFQQRDELLLGPADELLADGEPPATTAIALATDPTAVMSATGIPKTVPASAPATASPQSSETSSATITR
jgi:hypothetical protein